MDKETIMQLLSDGVISNEVAAKYFPDLKESGDERIRKEILDYIDKSTGCKRWVAWLEKQGGKKCTWKPSDAQMASITCAVRKMKESACYDSELVSLYQDLKKLKE